MTTGEASCGLKGVNPLAGGADPTVGASSGQVHDGRNNTVLVVNLLYLLSSCHVYYWRIHFYIDVRIYNLSWQL